MRYFDALNLLLVWLALPVPVVWVFLGDAYLLAYVFAICTAICIVWFIALIAEVVLNLIEDND